MTVWDSVAPDDYQELRIAVVMNGGVSLAIWIGGVGRELNRLTEARPDDCSCYGALLDLVKSRPRVDVLAGTSAGGINAGFLALGAVYGTDMKVLGKLWAEAGSLMELMRGPLDSETPSLLKGDSYFLPKLQEAFGELARAPSSARYPDDSPIDLTITTSLMDAAIESFVDDFGTQIQQADHRGTFRFVRGPQSDTDPFTSRDIVDYLALASRSTASFPLAFEASFVPVEPDTAPAGRTSLPARLVDFDRSRFVLDGGVLMNMPMQPALEAIFAQPAANEVRRVLAYVNPDPAAPAEAEADRFRNPPGVAEVLAAALIKLPAAQTISRELHELSQNNAQARLRENLRPLLLGALGNNPELADALFPAYCRIRTVRAAQSIASIVLDTAEDGPSVPASGRSGNVPGWTAKEIVDAFVAKRSEGDSEPAGAPVLQLPFIPDRRDLDGNGWSWGLAPVERLAIVALDILKRALYVAPFVPDGPPGTPSAPSPDVRRVLREGRRLIHDHLRDIRAMRREDTQFWRDSVPLPPPPSADVVERREVLQAWASNAAEQLTRVLSDAQSPDHLYTFAWMRHTVWGIVDVLIERVDELHAAASAGTRSDDPLVAESAEALEGMLRSLLGSTTESEEERRRQVVEQMLAVEVSFMVLTSGGAAQDQAVELMQISADLQHSFGGPGQAERKLAGVQLAHFGAFYKKSWRVNDWIWGRMDGALRLVEATLGPKRLRRLGLRVNPTGPQQTGIMELLRAAAVGSDPTGYLAEQFDKDRPAIIEELRFLDDLSLPVPARLPVTSEVISRRLYLEILDEELAALATAAEEDVDKGADKASAGMAFARTYRQESASPGGLQPERKLELFAESGIGRETILEEKGTDLFAATASRTAAVMTAVVNTPKIPAARAIFRPIRGLTLLLYSLVYGSVVGSKFGAWFVNLVLATGGALLALSLLSEVEVPAAIKVIAAAVVVAGLALAALRSGMLMLTAVLGLPLIGLAVYGLYRHDIGYYWQILVERQVQILTIAGLVIALGLLGYVRNFEWLRRLHRKAARSPSK